MKFKHKNWFKTDVDMNTELRKNAKEMIWKKILSNWGTMQFLEKQLKMQENRVIKLVSTKARRKYVFTSKPVYFGVAILEISRIVLHEFWYDYVKL